MSVALYRLAGIGLACALVTPASAQVLARKDLSAAMALTIAQTAIATCKTNGYAVSATVVGRNGEVIVQIRGDGTGPHTVENSFKKAFTSRTFRIPSGEIGRPAEEESANGRAVSAPGFAAGRGALAIMIGEEVIGAPGALSGTSWRGPPWRRSRTTARRRCATRRSGRQLVGAAVDNERRRRAVDCQYRVADVVGVARCDVVLRSLGPGEDVEQSHERTPLQVGVLLHHLRLPRLAVGL